MANGQPISHETLHVGYTQWCMIFHNMIFIYLFIYLSIVNIVHKIEKSIKVNIFDDKVLGKKQKVNSAEQ